MPGKVKVKIVAGRNLPVMDRSSDTTDAYVEIKLGNTTYKTDVCRKSLNPQWNSEWYRFEVDDSELQDEPLQIRLMDHDTYSANDAIGKVYLNLNPLLIPSVALPGKYGWSGETNDQPSSSVMSGWIPVFDTMHGIRGEVNVTVKVELFSDFNKFRQSSCGVQFFCSPVIPLGYHAQVIHGFIEELVVNDDPEYQWIDKIRTPRASNEARQTLFFKLSGELQRKIGVKALDLGGNAVIGYNQCFDLEGESGIVARGIGTVVTLIKHHEIQQQLDIGIAEEKALSYLKFLAFDNGLKLHSDNNFERLALSPPVPSKSLPSPIFPSPVFDTPTDQMTRSSPIGNIPIFLRQNSQPLVEFENHTPRLKTCISSRSLSDDIKEEIALRQLLQQEDMRGASSSALTRRIRNLKSSSQSMLSKKMVALKAKLSDPSLQEPLDYDTSSITTKEETGSIRSSLIDLRELRKQKKSRLKNNSYMAELLVRSVMHAHTSLDCIVECHDSGPALSVSTSKLNEDLGEGTSHQNGESQKSVLECDPVSGLINKTISEPYLLLPDNTGVTHSSNASSSSDLSSSEEDVSEGLSDVKEDDKLDFDTVSLIVKNVQEEEKQEKKAHNEMHFSFLDPPEHNNTTKNNTDKFTLKNELSVNSNMKIGALFRSHVLNSTQMPVTAPVRMNDNKNMFLFPCDVEKKIEELSHSALFKPTPRKKGVMSRGLSRSCEEISAPLQNENTHHEHESFLKTALHLFEKVNTVTSHVPHFLHKEKTKIESENKQSSSKSNPDLRNVSLVKTAVNTMLMEKVNLMTSQRAPVSPRAKEEIQSTSQSHPDLRDKSLVKTAMQTMLMEKIDLMTSRPAPVSQRAKEELQKKCSMSDPDIGRHSLIKSAMHTIHKVHILPSKSPSLSRKSKTDSNTNMNKTVSRSHPDLRNHNSVKSILMDKIHFLTHHHHHHHHEMKQKENDEEPLSRSHPDLRSHELKKRHSSIMNKFHFLTHHHHHEMKQKENDQESLSRSHPDLRSHVLKKRHSSIMDKIHFLTSKSPPVSRKTKETVISETEIENHNLPKIPNSPCKTSDAEYKYGETSKRNSSDLENHSLIKTAMNTMLIDKVNILTSEKQPVSLRAKEDTEDEHHDHAEELGNKSLIRTAMQTMLMDKVHILSPNSPPVPSPTSGEEFRFEDVQGKHSHSESEHHNFVKNAVHAVLDKVHKFGPKSPPHSPKSDEEYKFENVKPSHDDVGNNNLIKTAMQTMLIDKVQILTPKSPPISPQSEEEFKFDDTKKTEHSESKVKHAVHTILDKVHILHQKSPPVSPKSENEFKFETKTNASELNDQSLVQTAMHTMLIDKANIISPGASSVVCKHEDDLQLKNAQSDKDLELRNESLIKTAMQTMLIEKVNIISTKSAPISQNARQSFQSEDAVQNSDRKNKSIFKRFKKKCKSFNLNSPKASFSKFIHRHDSKKQNEDGLVDSAMSTMLMDRVNNIKELIRSTSNTIEDEESPIGYNRQISTGTNPTLVIIPETPTSSPETCTKKFETLELVDPGQTLAEQPNIKLGLDKGISCNKEARAVTADEANCNTNAEHAPCLYSSDRRIVESPVPEREREREREREPSVRERHGHQRTESTGGKMSQSPARLNAIPCIHRRSSDSDLSITPKGNSLTGSDRSGGGVPGYHHIRSTLLRPTVDNFDMMEYPFLTMSKYPPGFILHLGGAVSARSVKLLERITNIEEPETRDTWWSELRMEIRTHARALNCNAVLGYAESTSICDEVCVLSASGTAAVIALYSGELNDGVSGLPNLHKPHMPNKDLMTSSLDRTDFEREKNAKHVDATNTNTNNSKISQVSESPEQEVNIEFTGSTNVPQQATSCRICHIPYSESSMSFRVNMLYCSMCKLAKVPDILLTTIEMPEGLPITGRGCFLQSYVCRPKRDLKGELNAKEISESLPFLEYELHRLLVNKMKVKAMNTIFGLKVRITIGERMLVGIATGTAVFLLPLPPPPLPKLVAGNATTEEKKLAEMQKLLVDTVKKNKEIYELKDQDSVQPSKLLSDTEESDDEKSTLDLAAGNKDSCVLEVDDAEDIEVINLLVEARPPDGFHVVNTENVPGLEELEIVRNLQMFTQVWRAKISPTQSASHFGKHFQKLLQSVYFKLRRMIPCALCDLQFRVDLPEPDEIQLTLLGMALGLGDPMKLTKYKRKNLCHLPSKELSKKSADDELIFSLEEDHIPENSVPVISQSGLLNPQIPKHRQKSPQRLRVTTTRQRHTPIKERHGVDITPLSYVPGGKIERYLGYLNFFFIRETTSIREGGGLSGFVHSFITEVLAIVRAHVTALGGNAMVAYFMTECVLYHNAHKNQGQCLINVGGDVVFVSYFTEDT